MSLTGQLDKAGSPFASFLSAQFPAVNNVSAAFHAMLPADAEALFPAAPERVPWGTLATAIERRLRYAFCDTGIPRTSVQRGIFAAWQLATPDCAEAVRLAGEDLAGALESLVAAERPATRARSILLAPEEEAFLDGMCYALAWFEETSRLGRLVSGTPLATAGRSLTVEHLLAAVPGYAVDDIAAVVGLADTGLSSVRDDCPPELVHVSPALAGAGDVGGAEADLIAGDLLLEIRSTATPSRMGTRDFYQVLGYLLLDYADRYGIRRVGFYLSRFGRLVTWTVDEYLALLGSRRTLDDLRHECVYRLAPE
jgi:hypothetical protein